MEKEKNDFPQLIFTEEENLSDKQKMFLRVYDASLCNVSLSCNKTNVGRTTFYYWMKENPSFKKNVDNIKESQVDFAESKLMQEIRNGNTTAIIFFLKTQGKERGYVERTEQDVSINKFEELMQSLPDDE